ncbi:MAG: hypothetical protein FWH29_09900 [Methanobrevibacter sp.]|nr:hypothetical protein [Methanobrevibacter sp.]
MDQFFKELREIQKKERANSSLARVGSDFYKRTYNYLDKLKANIGNDPFSNEHYLLKDIQRITTEICERREHKITDIAVMNIHRSYHLFKGKPKFDLLDTTPINLTNEEKELYLSLIDTLTNHRQSISLDKLTEGLENDSTKTKPEPNNVFKNNSQDLDLSKKKIANATSKNNNASNKNEEQTGVEKNIKINNHSDKNRSNNESSADKESFDKVSADKKSFDKVVTDKKSVDRISVENESFDKVKTDKESYDDYSNDNVLNRLNEIKKAKVIEDEKYESVNEQLNKFPGKSQVIETESGDLKENTVYKNVKSSQSDSNNIKFEKTINDDDLDNVLKDEDKQFAELKNENFSPVSDFDESISLSKDYNVVNETILIFSKIGAIVGVDEKIYGPFYPQDIVVMPNVNANIIIKNKKGRIIKT